MNNRAPGFTLVEMLVVTVVATVLLGAIFQTLVVQQRSYREQNAIINARQTARASIEVLAAELREVSATDGDLIMATADSLTIRAYRKMGIVCRPPQGANLHYWQLGDPFEDGELIMIFVDGDPDTGDDDTWREAGISSVSSGWCPEDWGGRPWQSLVVSTGSAAHDVLPGAPLRGFRNVTYGHYQIDGEWVLGRRVGGSGVEALVGPVAAPTTDHERDGLRFRYFDEFGTELAPLPLDAANRKRVARIEVTVNGRALGRAQPGDPELLERLVTQVALRGNTWN